MPLNLEKLRYVRCHTPNTANVPETPSFALGQWDLWRATLVIRVAKGLRYLTNYSGELSLAIRLRLGALRMEMVMATVREL